MAFPLTLNFQLASKQGLDNSYNCIIVAALLHQTITCLPTVTALSLLSILTELKLHLRLTPIPQLLCKMQITYATKLMR